MSEESRVGIVLVSHSSALAAGAAELASQVSGGQVRVEILDHRWSPAQFLTPYVAGLYHRPMFAPSRLPDEELAAAPSVIQSSPASAIYVNRGLGTVGVPFRFDCAPQITLFTLRA